MGRCESWYQLWILSKCEGSHWLYHKFFIDFSRTCIKTIRLSLISEQEVRRNWKINIETWRTLKNDHLRKHLSVSTASSVRVKSGILFNSKLWAFYQIIFNWFEGSTRRLIKLRTFLQIVFWVLWRDSTAYSWLTFFDPTKERQLSSKGKATSCWAKYWAGKEIWVCVRVKW